jgi:hypothetical protein
MKPLYPLLESLDQVQGFQKRSLTRQIAELEKSLYGLKKEAVTALCLQKDVTSVLLDSALSLKRAASQIHVIIHAVGIALSLPYLLDEDEQIEFVSLGAGNTGKAFDLQTDRRIAEFKFIHWQGGSETIRQNALFKDFYLLAESEITKRKFLYVVDDLHPLKFFNSGRAIKSIFSRFPHLMDDMRNRYGERFLKVKEYYGFKKSTVAVVDLKRIVPAFAKGFDLSVDNEVDEL